MGDATLDVLRAVLGEGGVGDPPLETPEGLALEAALAPVDGEALAEVLRVCTAAGAGLLLRGGGSRLGFANVPCSARFLLELGGEGAPPEIDSDEGVALLSAATALGEVRDALAGSGWELPLDPPGARTTVGGTLAAAAAGPRFGVPKDAVLGMQVCLASGERVKFGGRVVKNVTGYDLSKLFVGSFGTLGVIESAWVRLRPVPEVTRVFRARERAGGDGSLTLARLSTARVCAVSEEGAARELLLELGGDAPAVDADLAAARAVTDLEETDATAVDGLRDQQGAGPVRARVAGLPTCTDDAAASFRADGAVATLGYPARGTAYARFEVGVSADEPAIGAIWQAARRASERGKGPFAIEAAPVDVRRGHDVFGRVGDTLPLQREIKRQYDPAGILNPGRFAGRL